jgi:hypothetical protein
MNSTVKSEFSHFKQFSIDLHENEPICQMKSEPQVSIHRQRSCIINKELSSNREGIPPRKDLIIWRGVRTYPFPYAKKHLFL